VVNRNVDPGFPKSAKKSLSGQGHMPPLARLVARFCCLALCIITIRALGFPFRHELKGRLTMQMTRERFEQTVASVLRDHGSDVTADLTDQLVAYWDGHGVAYVMVCEISSGSPYEEFVMDDEQWKQCRPWLEAWLESPAFSVRPEVRNWRSEAPPFEPEA
jgi:hypothetical protein